MNIGPKRSFSRTTFQQQFISAPSPWKSENHYQQGYQPTSRFGWQLGQSPVGPDLSTVSTDYYQYHKI